MSQEENLSCECVDYESRHFDFSEGFAEKWDLGFNLTDEEQESEEFYPMMNYIYPLPRGFKPSEEDKEKLNNTTIVCLMDEEEYYLALTGGGMDLSWEICESYINLGFLPPKHFCDLPRMAGRGESESDKRIIKACLRSFEVSEHRNEYGKSNLLAMLKK